VCVHNEQNFEPQSHLTDRIQVTASSAVVESLLDCESSGSSTFSQYPFFFRSGSDEFRQLLIQLSLCYSVLCPTLSIAWTIFNQYLALHFSNAWYTMTDLAFPGASADTGSMQSAVATQKGEPCSLFYKLQAFCETPTETWNTHQYGSENVKWRPLLCTGDSWCKPLQSLLCHQERSDNGGWLDAANEDRKFDTSQHHTHTSLRSERDWSNADEG
jgi:hypothetical protein